MSEQSQPAAMTSPFMVFGLAVALVCLLLDQISKWWVLNIFGLVERGRVHILPHFDLVFVKNKGVSYGMFSQDSMAGQWFLIAFAAIAVVVMAVWLIRSQARLVAASLGLIIGGAIGNSIDRALYGGVVDFISLYGFDFYWYVFNLADTAIVAGVVGLIYDSIFANRKNASKIP